MISLNKGLWVLRCTLTGESLLRSFGLRPDPSEIPAEFCFLKCHWCFEEVK